MKYAPSAIGLGELRGSSGAATASRNRYGAYIRARVVPVNPNTDNQNDVRDFFAFLAQGWRELTESQRTSWTSIAQQVPITDSLGQSMILSGNAMYAKVNILRRQVGDAIIDDAPALDQAPVILTSTATVDDGPTMSLAYTADGGIATNNIIVRATSTRSPGKTYVGRGELKQIFTFAGNAASPAVVIAGYNAIFGTGWQTQLGMEIIFELQGVSENGLPGATFRTRADVVAGA
jgi:hypothetical protein